MSGNSFRRATQAKHQQLPDNADDVAYKVEERFPDIEHVPPPNPRTKTKRVRISSPPHSPSSPSSPAHAPPQLIRQRSGSPPPPLREAQVDVIHDVSEDPFDRGSDGEGASTEDDEVIHNTRRNPGAIVSVYQAYNAPSNPFQKTLATMEPSANSASSYTENKCSAEPTESVGRSVGKEGLDVDSFARLLMTGKPTLPQAGISVQSSQSAQRGTPGVSVLDSSSSTDASSTSRQSICEPIQDMYTESPRTSYERSLHSEDDDDEHSSLMGEVRKEEKKPPPPPKHKHGKMMLPARGPQTVSFSQFPSSSAAFVPGQSMLPYGPITPPITSPARTLTPKTPTDLNKPLPPPPPISKEPEPGLEMFPDVKQIGGSEVLPQSAGDSVGQKKVAPPPPLSRRHSQLKSSGGRPRSTSNSSLSSQPEQRTEEAQAFPADNMSTHSSSNKAPPPPPARRGGANTVNSSFIPNISTVPPTPFETSRSEYPFRQQSLPAVRTPSSNSIKTRTPSNSSTTRPNITSPLSAHGSVAPPPPPPRRGSGRTSIDGPHPPSSSSPVQSRRASGEGRKSSGEYRRPSADALRRLSQDSHGQSGRRTSAASISSLERVSEHDLETSQTLPAAPSASAAKGVEGNTSVSNDILSDMEAFQREVDALRLRMNTA